MFANARNKSSLRQAWPFAALAASFFFLAFASLAEDSAPAPVPAPGAAKESAAEKSPAPEREPEAALFKHVLLHTTLGTLRVELLPHLAPEHVRRFLALCGAKVYDGTLFNRVQRGQGLETGHFATRAHPVTPEQRALIENTGAIPSEPTSALRTEKPVHTLSYGSVYLLFPQKGETIFSIYMANSPRENERYMVLGRVVAGFEALTRIADVRVNDQGFPKTPLALMDTEVVEPTHKDSFDPALEQLYEERYRKMADPRYLRQAPAEGPRETATQRPAAGGASWPALVSCLGLVLFFLGGRLPPRLLAALGAICFLTGAFGLYVCFFEAAQREVAVGMALFFGSLGAFWLLRRW